MPSIQSLKASDGSGNANTATVTVARTAPATTLQVDTVTGIPTNFHATMGTPHTFTDPVTSETITVISEATAVDFKGHVDGSNLEIDTIAPGYTDGGSEVGDIVIIRPTTQWADEVVSVLQASLDDDGSMQQAAIAEGLGSTRGVLGNVEYYTSSDTWTKPAGLKFVIVEVQGAGGGGGGAAATGGGNNSAGGGGGGGGYSRKKIAAASLASSETVTVGTGGAGGSGASTGSNGNDSSFGSHCTGGGGLGGLGAGQSTLTLYGSGGGDGGAGSGGDLNISGGDGGQGLRFTTRASSGRGGRSLFGSEVKEQQFGGGGGANGTPGKSYGGGGGGAANGESNVSNRTGGTGASGIVIVYEYY